MKIKRVAAWIIMLCLCMTACHKTSVNPSDIRLYYKNADVQYNAPAGVLGTQTITAAVPETTQLLQDYLSGPETAELISPFPAGTKLMYFSVSQDTAQVTLSSEFASLSGVDLTIACACLSLTVQDITKCAAVEISAVDSLLDNQSSITMDPHKLSFYDPAQ